jgi:TPR repeat protein
MQCEAMLVIADSLIAGWPVPRNFSEGIRWLKRAAKLGSGPAKALLEYHGAA